jgi:DNA-binding protein YbaB
MTGGGTGGPGRPGGLRGALGEDFGTNPFAASYEQRIAEAKAELEAVQAGVARAQAELRQASVTLRSKDRAVEVTVGPQGELTDVKFLDGKYRTMGAGELAADVLETATRARAQISRQVMALFEPFTRPSSTVPELSGVEVDWKKLLGAGIFEDEEETKPGDRAGRGPAQGGRPSRSRRLRDEINEDTEDEGHG